MKKIVLIAISFLSLNAFAVSRVSCDSIDGSAVVTMHISSTGKISSVRLQKNNASAQSFSARFIKTSNNISIYSLSGTSDLLRAENTIENYGFGRAEIGRLNLDCN